MSAYAMNLFPLPQVSTPDPTSISKSTSSNCNNDSNDGTNLTLGLNELKESYAHPIIPVTSIIQQNEKQIKVINSHVDTRAYFFGRRKRKNTSSQTLVSFDLSVTHNSRKYTIRRSLRRIVKLHAELVQEEGNSSIPELPECINNLDGITDYNNVGANNKRHRTGYSMLQTSLRLCCPVIEEWLLSVCHTYANLICLKIFLRDLSKTTTEIDDDRLSSISEDEEEEDDNEYDLYFGEDEIFQNYTPVPMSQRSEQQTILWQ